jgi:hypothetical protein
VTDARTTADCIGDERRRLAALHGCPEDLLPFKIKGEPGYSACGPYEGLCGGCDECLLTQWTYALRLAARE